MKSVSHTLKSYLLPLLNKIKATNGLMQFFLRSGAEFQREATISLMKRAYLFNKNTLASHRPKALFGLTLNGRKKKKNMKQ